MGKDRIFTENPSPTNITIPKREGYQLLGFLHGKHWGTFAPTGEYLIGKGIIDPERIEDGNRVQLRFTLWHLFLIQALHKFEEKSGMFQHKTRFQNEQREEYIRTVINGMEAQ